MFALIKISFHTKFEGERGESLQFLIEHGDSIFSTATIKLVSTDEEQAWLIIRKKLENLGMSETRTDANKNFIMYSIKEAMSYGLFDKHEK